MKWYTQHCWQARPALEHVKAPETRDNSETSCLANLETGLVKSKFEGSLTMKISQGTLERFHLYCMYGHTFSHRLQS